MIQYNKSDNTNKIIVSQDFGENRYSKNIRATIQIIVSQDFGENKYSKNIRVTIQILQLRYKTLVGILTAK